MPKPDTPCDHHGVKLRHLQWCGYCGAILVESDFGAKWMHPVLTDPIRWRR